MGDRELTSSQKFEKHTRQQLQGMGTSINEVHKIIKLMAEEFDRQASGLKAEIRELKNGSIPKSIKPRSGKAK